MNNEELFEEFCIEIRKLYNKVEAIIDDYLPDTFSYARKKADNYAYAENLKIDGDDIKLMLSQSFRGFSSQFIEKFIENVELFLSAIKDKNEQEELEYGFKSYEEELENLVNDIFKNLAYKRMEEFKYEFEYNYKPNQNFEYKSFENKLMQSLEEEFNFNFSQMRHLIVRQFHEVSQNFLMQRKSQVKKEKEVDNFKEKVLNAINWYKKETQDLEFIPEELSSSFEVFYSYAERYLNSGVPINKLPEDFIDEFRLAISKFVQELNKFLNEKKDESNFKKI